MSLTLAHARYLAAAFQNRLSTVARPRCATANIRGGGSA